MKEEERQKEREQARLDRFAAAALVGLLSHGGSAVQSRNSLAAEAWATARAMVETGPKM